MIRRHNIPMAITMITVCQLSCFVPAQAFAEWNEDSAAVESRAVLRSYVSVYQYPEDDILYQDRNASGIAGIARLILDGKLGEHWDFDFNAYQAYIPNDLLSPANTGSGPVDVERSDALEKDLGSGGYAHLAIDRAALRWANEDVDITFGRQSINLATTFYFTPNDFFAPFSAHSFYRIYKPGVDSLRAEIGLAELSQLSLISVLGYKPDPGSDTG